MEITRINYAGCDLHEIEFPSRPIYGSIPRAGTYVGRALGSWMANMVSQIGKKISMLMAEIPTAKRVYAC